MLISKITNGFGNNLFQCIAGKLISEKNNLEHFFLEPYENYYGSDYLNELGFKKVSRKDLNEKSKIYVINDSNYQKIKDIRIDPVFFENGYMILDGYFENKDYYLSERKTIKSWFPEIKRRNKKDLVFHFRTGDRLFYKNEFDSKPSPVDIKKAIERFDFERLHIVTDMPVWKKYSEEDLKKIDFHVKVPKEKSVSISKALEYYNECYDMLQKFNPVVERKTVLEDFNLIRSFDNILFQHGTMSWWASFLSDAKKVGVYGPWRPWKGKGNKNLSNVNINGWFKWE